jgi:hypothetical protein
MLSTPPSPSSGKLNKGKAFEGSLGENLEGMIGKSKMR